MTDTDVSTFALAGLRRLRVVGLPTALAFAIAASWLTLTGSHHPAVVAVPAVPPPQAKPPRIPPIIGAAGLTPHAAALARYVQTTYPGVSTIGGVRPDGLPDHPSGHAIDIMVGSNTRLGNQIQADLLARASEFSIRYLIWQETYRNPSGAARFMADRGSPTANHYDHVHVTVNG